MKIQSQNRLAHYQLEYQELMEQTNMLIAQLSTAQAEVANLFAYLQCNDGDRRARSDYSKAIQRVNHLQSSINHNNLRCVTLQRQIAIENNKIQVQSAKAMMSACRVPGRSAYRRRNYYGSYMY